MSEVKPMISLDQALEIVKSQVAGKTVRSETIPVRQGLGRIVIEDQIACLDLPPFNKSAMDGFAVRQDDIRQQYKLIETVPAGKVPAKKLEHGTAIKVMTGAPVPEGAGQVIMVEHTRTAGDTVDVFCQSKETHICLKGEDIRRGDRVLKAPAVLGPLEIANLISAGITTIKAAAKLNIAILTTGDEIVDSPDLLESGKIMNSNGPLLEALCRKYALDVTTNRIIPDEMQTTIEAMRDALNTADIVVLSGGVSAGDFDFAAAAMERIGLQVHFNRLAVKPGKPMTFASSDDKVVFGLPGNPVAVFLMFHLFVLYAARLLCGLHRRPCYVNLPLAADFHRRKADRTAFIPCRLSDEGVLKTFPYHGTAHLHALLESDGFFVVDQDVTEIAAGQRVRFLSIRDNFA